MLYEASSRVNNPIYGCTADILQLQKEIAELESQLAATEAELNYMRSQYGKFMFILGIGSVDDQFLYPTDATSPSAEYISHEEVNPYLWSAMGNVEPVDSDAH